MSVRSLLHGDVPRLGKRGFYWLLVEVTSPGMFCILDSVEAAQAVPEFKTSWLGLKVDFLKESPPEARYLSLTWYPFQDSELVEGIAREYGVTREDKTAVVFCPTGVKVRLGVDITFLVKSSSYASALTQVQRDEAWASLMGGLPFRVMEQHRRMAPEPPEIPEEAPGKNGDGG